jgi:type III secretion system low calcium response chaperone LcrH/SycD
MQGDTQRVKEATDIVGHELKAKSADQLQNMTSGLIQKGGVPKDFLGVSDAMIEGIYGQAYRLYNTGKYNDATQLFRLLVMLNATEFKYCMGLAACYHMQKEYKSAVETYTVCSLLESDNPVPHFHASDCYIQMQNPVSALVVLEMAVKRAGNQAQYATLKDRALLTMASLRKEIARLKE